MALGSTQPLTEMSTRNFPGGKKRPARRADNLPTSMSRIPENVEASTSRNPTGLHGLYRGNFTLPLGKRMIEGQNTNTKVNWTGCGRKLPTHLPFWTEGCVPAESLTVHLPSISQKRYCFSQLARYLRKRKKGNEGIQTRQKKIREEKENFRSHTRPLGHRLVSSAYAIRTMEESSEVWNNNNKSL
jgi:hypothetical protein